MKNIFYKWLAIFCLLITAGCSTAPNKRFPILAEVKQSFIAQQQWQLTYEQERYVLQVVIETDFDQWRWILLNNFDQRLATASIVGDKLSIERNQSHPVESLIPDLIEAVQLGFWPLGDLQFRGNPNWKIEENSRHRSVFLSGILHATVDIDLENPWQGTLKYNNKKRGFQLLIESQLLN